MSTHQPEVTPQLIMQNLWMARGAQVLVAGVELDIFTHIHNGKRTAKEIARAAGANPRATERLLNALVGMDYLEQKKGSYTLKPISEAFLVRGKEAYLGGIVNETKMTWAQWANLTEAIKTGRPFTAVDTETDGKKFFPQLVEAIFPMSYGNSRTAVAMLPGKTLKRIKTILDVAAGSAAWSLAFAQAIPEARVTVLDYPEVTPVARRFAEAFGVADRYDYLEGNLREIDFGRNRYDLVILGHIIHTEGEKWGKKLIQKAYRALNDGGTLLIAEMIPNDTRTGPPLPLLFGLNMLVHTEQGNVFTMREYREWLKAAGFKKVSTLDAQGPSPLILATK